MLTVTETQTACRHRGDLSFNAVHTLAWMLCCATFPHPPTQPPLTNTHTLQRHKYFRALLVLVPVCWAGHPRREDEEEHQFSEKGTPVHDPYRGNKNWGDIWLNDFTVAACNCMKSRQVLKDQQCRFSHSCFLI